MPSYTTITVRNTTGERANDLHLAFDQVVEVLAVGELSPGDRRAGYTLEGDGTETIDISAISAGAGGAIDIRVKGREPNRPSVIRNNSHWTRDGQDVGPVALGPLPGGAQSEGKRGARKRGRTKRA
ncbi:MAG: hypothetical protein HY330_03340 [Chloroflexi bacterium]|nr:hypothetical protein [Chloroflexota bacterium]